MSSDRKKCIEFYSFLEPGLHVLLVKVRLVQEENLSWQKSIHSSIYNNMAVSFFFCVSVCMLQENWWWNEETKNLRCLDFRHSTKNQTLSWFQTHSPVQQVALQWNIQPVLEAVSWLHLHSCFVLSKYQWLSSRKKNLLCRQQAQFNGKKRLEGKLLRICFVNSRLG